jgi:RNA polymerase-binding protein DksA
MEFIMIREKIDFYRAILLERRKFILNNIARLKDLSQTNDAEENQLEKYNDHLADTGSDSWAKEETFLLMSRELKYLNKIDDALKSLDKGLYGICKICGGEIPQQRLEAVPTTDTCYDCKNIPVKKLNLN